MSLDSDFGRLLLAQITPTVKDHTTAAQRKAAWTYHFGRGQWEFHGPDHFYWHGRASSAYEARYKGWIAYLESKGIDIGVSEDELA
jgi:hypothetical protein